MRLLLQEWNLGHEGLTSDWSIAERHSASGCPLAFIRHSPVIALDWAQAEREVPCKPKILDRDT